MFSCPLCCGEKFSDVKELTAHLSSISKRLRCALCDIRFDNIMVMIKHLERGCSGKGLKSATSAESLENNTVNVSQNNTGSFNDIEMSAAQSAGDSDNDNNGAPENIKDDIKDIVETISEDQYIDKNGQAYRRRVVKISNLWTDLSSTKLAEEDVEEVGPPLVAVASKNGPARCPLCAKVLKGEHSLRLHLEVAHREQTHSCCYCTQVFQSEQALKQHVSVRHSMPYSCVYCNKPFNNLLMAKKHVQCHKTSRKPAFQCELCAETAHTNTEIKRHYREVHLQELQPRDAPTPIAPYKKGSLWYEWRGYTYHQTHTTRSGVQVLRCWVDGCWAEVRLPVIGSVASQGEHTHQPYTWLRERNELYNSLRRRCMTETTPIRIIYDEESFRYPEGAKNLVFPEATMRSWQRHLIQKMEDPRIEITLENEALDVLGPNSTQEVVSIPNSVTQVAPGRGRKRKLVPLVEM